MLYESQVVEYYVISYIMTMLEATFLGGSAGDFRGVSLSW